jgi:Dolichyl-phosphate-mannose-protein mannosyltransferase
VSREVSTGGRRESSRTADRVALILVWLIGALYLAPFVTRGWVPHDEGCLSHMAERVLAGEIPHKDFDEIYSGGLTYLHALSFRIAGENLVSMRYVLLTFVLLWIPAVYAIARRFSKPVVAGAVTLLALVWSVPNYFASLPSWYNLFFATFGILCLFKNVETGRKSWLFLAGVCGGLSFLVKMVGLYYIAAALLFLLFREGALERSSPAGEPRRSPLLLGVKTAAVLVFVGFLVFLLGSRPQPAEIVNLAVPALSVAAVLLWSEARLRGGPSIPRLRRLLVLAAPFLLGIAVPVALFLLPYALRSAIGDFVRGVFLLPQKRLASAAMVLPRLSTAVPILPYVLLLVFPFRRISRRREWIAALATAALLGLLLAGSKQPEIYYQIWNSARSITAVAILLAGLSLIAPDRETDVTPERQQKLFLLACVTALVALVQFPFGAPVYYCYVAPLGALTLAAVVETRRTSPKLLHGCVLAFFALFAILRTNPGYLWNLGHRYDTYEPTGWLQMERGGLRIPAADERDYVRVLGLVREHARGRHIYAAPDCPEIYFLSGRRNLTRNVFDFNSSFASSSLPLLAFLNDNDVHVVVVNRSPDFSRPIAPNVLRLLERVYPGSAEAGRFLVRWQD